MVIIQYDNDGILPLSTLAANDVISVDTKIDGSRLQGFRIAVLSILATITGKTATEGPLLWGVSCNMAAGSIESAIESDPQSSAADNNRGEGAWLKILGMIGLEVSEGPLTGGNSLMVLPLNVKVNWSVIEGQSLQVWVYNMGAALTTGTVFHFAIEEMGVWLRD